MHPELAYHPFNRISKYYKPKIIELFGNHFVIELSVYMIDCTLRPFIVAMAIESYTPIFL